MASAPNSGGGEVGWQEGVHVLMLGARRHYAVPRLLDEAGLLGQLYTDSYAGNKPRLASCVASLPTAIRPPAVDRWLDRAEPTLATGRVTSFAGLGIRYALARRHAAGSIKVRRVYARFARAFNQRVVQRLDDRSDVRALWGFNGAALETFNWARERGVPCVLEQTIAPISVQRGLLAREVELWPGWQPELEIPPAVDELEQRETREWAAADVIVAGSSFVVQGLASCGVPTDSCRIVPYGVDADKFSESGAASARPSSGECRPLRVLFAGEVGLRKGAPYLLEALVKLGPSSVHAKFAGPLAVAAAKLPPYEAVADFLGILPRRKMPTLYRWADVLCLPSVCEGSATVTYEALSAGVPVVTTPNAGSRVSDGENGRVVPTGNVDALLDALEQYCDDSQLLANHSARALEMREEIGLARYGQELVSVIEALPHAGFKTIV